ncbi:N-acetylmuramoyl-L-alanine amidase [Salinihabitans flavidus]|uniref:N-acetylmuramoyl-L-alanine amidase n=1 Tax=Salinihabitans flavidus TaxID=569882 RepID=A0A1H8RSU4_9RHOB|nr:N-acetylmuramoyl-L-alanine amidase [Salinihabitans flavidus]SEO69254.1 N-acetylmuramoyl-L-alanine amidase [Salinihabitans flavidus]
MRKIICAVFLWGCAAFFDPASAQDFSALARLDADRSTISDARRGGVRISLSLSQGVPWRVFTLDDPRRLVLDFREVEWAGASPESLDQSEAVSALRMGAFRPGWSRMVLDLAVPLKVAQAGMRVSEETGSAHLLVDLAATTSREYTALAGAPRDPRWDLPEPSLRLSDRPEKPDWAPTVVVLDPGHGGVDPGAERDGHREKDMMLRFARELRDTLRRAGGFKVVLTRDEDIFVSLEQRVAIAHQAGADVFLSLHADILADGGAQGATIYTLSKEASDAASRQLAERQNRADIIAGVDLSGTDDVVADVLLDLARLETRPRTERLARAMVLGMKNTSGDLNSRPYRQAAFSVLKAADIPSVLVEVGFLSSDRDFENLQSPNWRASVAAGIRDGLQAWVIADKAQKELVRQ